jgi:hypothetical protein
MEIQESKQINEAEVRSAAIKEATQRAVSINDLCGKWNMSARAAEFIASDKSFDEIRSEVLTEVEKRSADIEINKTPVDAVRQSAPAVHTREKDVFNVAKALRAAIDEDWTNAGFEKEMSQEGVRGTGQSWNKRTFTVDLNQRADSISTVGTAGSVGNLVAEILSDNNISDAGLRWLTNRGTMLTLGNTLNDSANTNSGYIIPLGVTADSLLGKPVAVSNNVPATLTKGTGTGLSPIIAGDFSEFFVGQWNNLVVKVDETTGADNSLVFIRSYSWWDFMIKRLEAFVAIKDVITL